MNVFLLITISKVTSSEAARSYLADLTDDDLLVLLPRLVPNVPSKFQPLVLKNEQYIKTTMG